MDSRLKISGMTKKYYKGALPPHNPLKRRKHKDKNQKKKQKLGFPIKDFGNDRKGRSSLLIASITLVCHPWMILSGVQKQLKNQRKSKNVDSRLKISGMTKKGGRHSWMPLSSPSPSFLNASIRNLNYLRTKISGCPPKFQAWERGKPFRGDSILYILSLSMPAR